jgi:hypothetical protein
MFMTAKLADRIYPLNQQPMLSFWTMPVLPLGRGPEATARKLCLTCPNAAALR